MHIIRYIYIYIYIIYIYTSITYCVCALLGVQDKIVFDLDSNGIQCAEAVQLSDRYIYISYVAD